MKRAWNATLATAAVCGAVGLAAVLWSILVLACSITVVIAQSVSDVVSGEVNDHREAWVGVVLLVGLIPLELKLYASTLRSWLALWRTLWREP